MKKVFPVILALLVGMILPACRVDDVPEYSDFVDIDPKGWYPGVSAELSPYPMDSVVKGKSFILDFAVRYTEAAPDSVKLVLISESFLTEMKRDTISLTLRHRPSRPSGKGGLGVYTLVTRLSDSCPVPEGWRIAVEPVSRTPGIISVGFILNRK